MLYGRQLAGLPVYTEDNVYFATVKGYAADSEGVLQYLLINCRGLLGRDMRLPAEQIKELSIKGVFLKKGKKLAKAPHNKPKDEYIGACVYNCSGACLGNISDVLLADRRIYAVELSGGLYDDLLNGRKELPINSLIPFSQGFKIP